MAFASSRIGTQEAIIKPCDLCEDEENVNWFCVDCIQNLCERCKKGHVKIAMCRNHRLVPILEGIAIQKTKVSNLCQEHIEPFSFFCRTCEENLCPMCLSMVHKKHDFTDLRNLNSELQSRLENAIKEKEDEQVKMTNNIDDLQKSTNHYRDALKKNYATIDDRMQTIITAVDEEGHKLKETLKTATEEQIKAILERKQKLKRIKNDYDEAIQTVKQELTLQTTPTFRQFFKSSISKIQSLKPMTFSVMKGIMFNDGMTKHDLIADMIGKTEGQIEIKESGEQTGEQTREQTGEQTGEQERFFIFSEIHIIKRHQINVHDGCSCICTSSDGSILLGDSRYVYKMSSDCLTILHTIQHRRQKISHKRIFSFAFTNIACLTSGDVIASYQRDKTTHIGRFAVDGGVVEFLIKPRECPLDIAITHYDEVVVGFDFDKSMYAYISSLVKYSKEGRQLNTITLDKNAKVTGFCINNDDNYVITDIGSSLFITLITLDGSGTVLKKIRMSMPGLYRMRCDSYGNILGLPRKTENKSVYLISDDGDVKRHFNVDCAETINDICIDHDDRLLILVDDTKVIVAKYLEGK